MERLGKKVRRRTAAAKNGWRRGDGDVREFREAPEPLPPPPPISVGSIIDRTLAACVRDNKRPYLSPQRDEVPRPKHVVHPSSVAGCPRALGFELLDAAQGDVGSSNLPRTRLQRIFDNGHCVHQRLQGYLFEAEKRRVGSVERVWEDVKLRFNPLLIEGELDQALRVCGRLYVVEYKSSNLEKFEKLDKIKPNKEWLWQAYCYMAALGIRAAVIVVECKNDQKIKEYYVPWNEAKWKEISARITSVLDDIRKKIQPEADTTKCHFCPYKSMCDVKGGDSKLIPWRNLSKIDFDRMTTHDPHTARRSHA